ncbi:hypothetical protein NOGI109294_13280 [Nocardiopsis gilva]
MLDTGYRVARNVLLFIMYFAIVTPVGLAIRLFHDPLHRQRDASVQSYWVHVESNPPNNDSIS